MSGPAPKTRTTHRGRSCCLGLISTSIFAAGGVRAEECPAPAPIELEETNTLAADQPIEFQADGLEATRDGAIVLKGDVALTQGPRRLRTEEAAYDSKTQRFETSSGVEYSEPALTVRGSGARVESAGAAEFDDAQFELRSVNARGGAKRIRATTQGELELDGVYYTTCPLGNEDWVLRADDININQRLGLGVGRGVRLDFMGVPLFYTPFISFPVGDERKSGFLFPSVGTSSSSGSSISVPWYWNIAPNYDATFAPTWYAKRGGRLDTEFRYLTAAGRGVFDAAYLPSDQESNGDARSLLRFSDQSDLTARMRLDVDAANASDSRWFEDFGLGPEGTSTTYLQRVANLTYLSRNVHAVLRAQNFQTIDDAIAPNDRPHTLLPQLAVQASFPDQWFGLTLGLDSEIGNFEHNVAGEPSGWRFDLAPEVSMPLRGAGVYLEPSATYRYTTYRLHDAVGGIGDDSPTRSMPIMSVDGGLIFERPQGSKAQRLLTLEPRFVYLYAPYRNQADLPVFDTTVADLNLVQLFRTNRYVGLDRISNANQISIGFTSRLLDADSGRQYISGTVGQAYYFDPPQVPLETGLTGAPESERSLDNAESSDIIAELGVSAYANWNVSMGVQWNPHETRSERGDVRLQYQPAADRVANLSYRFRRGAIEQVDGSVAWPLTDEWSAYGRMVYSLQDSAALDQFAGFEYRACCWRLRVVGRRYVSDRTGDRDTSILLQLELNGLSSVGVGAGAFLERSIRGYSFSPPDSQ